MCASGPVLHRYRCLGLGWGRRVWEQSGPRWPSSAPSWQQSGPDTCPGIALLDGHRRRPVSSGCCRSISGKPGEDWVSDPCPRPGDSSSFPRAPVPGLARNKGSPGPLASAHPGGGQLDRGGAHRWRAAPMMRGSPWWVWPGTGVLAPRHCCPGSSSPRADLWRFPPGPGSWWTVLERRSPGACFPGCQLGRGSLL